MAKMKKEQVEKIVAKELPGYRLRQSSSSIDAPRTHAPAEASTPEVDELMKKFGITGTDSRKTSLRDIASWDGQVSNGEPLDDEIAVVEREDGGDPFSRANRPKAKVVSSNGKIIGSQG